MSREEIRGVATEFVTFVQSERGAEDDDDRLALLLDQLALASHFAPRDYDAFPSDDDLESDSPVTYEAIGKRFPVYGCFEIAFPFSAQPGDTELAVADSVDAIGDILGELMQVIRIWNRFGVDNALARYRFSYDSHSHYHLREVQLYLHARKLARG